MGIAGTSVTRADAWEKASGSASYVGDLSVPDMAYGKLLGSPVPHALIKAVDARRARALSGVVGVLTADRMHDIEPFYGSHRKDRPIVAMEKVRFEGEPVAAVAAVDQATAEEALELIEVEYEELPEVTDVEAALEPESPRVHGSNECHRYQYAWGDVEQGFARSERVFEDSFTFPMVYHYALEPHAAIASFDERGLTVWSSAQHPFLVREELARIFHLPLQRVRVVAPYLGGGFGSKSYTKIEPLVAALSREAGRPVKVELTVEEAFRTVRRHSARCTLRTGVRGDGTFLARECVIYLDTGAYADNGVLVTERAGTRILGAYRWPHVNVRSCGVYTNTTPAGSFRSIAGPQAAFACESQVDVIAADLGVDPLELRMRNLATPGEEIRPGMRPLEADLRGGLRRVARAVGWPGRPHSGSGKVGKGANSPVKRGLGLACAVTNAGSTPTTTALARLHADGSLTILVGTAELGQGARTALAQIAAEELGLALEGVEVVTSDTRLVPYDRSTGSSRSTTLMGLAAQGAAAEVRQQLGELASRRLEAPLEELAFAGGRVRYREEEASYSELVRERFGGPGGELLGRGYVSPDHPGGRLGSLPIFWEVGIGAAEVEVNEETGAVRVVRYYSVADAGKAINPRQCEAQDEGAAMQGLGHTLLEEMLYDEARLQNGNMADYRVPTFDELPDVFETILVENGDGPGPYGAKGLGEGGVTPVAPAVANALWQATGVRFRELPLTPERVWRTIREVKGG